MQCLGSSRVQHVRLLPGRSSTRGAMLAAHCRHIPINGRKPICIRVTSTNDAPHPTVPGVVANSTPISSEQQAAAAQEAAATSTATAPSGATSAPSGAASAATASASASARPQHAKSADATDTLQSHPLNLSPDELFAAKELVSELQDTRQFGKRGEAYLFAQVVLFMLVLIPPFTLKGVTDLVGTLLITGGIVFAVYGLFSLGRYLSPLPMPRKKHELVTTGLYSYVRHPMYAGLIAISIGLAIVTRNECRLVLAGLLWLLLERKAALEESYLSELYSEAYAKYRAHTKKFFPKVY